MTAHRQAPDQSRSVLGQENLSIILIVLGFAPLMWWHMGGLLERPHYQFLFLLPVLLWMLISAIDPVKLEPTSKTEAISGSVILMLSLVGLVYAAWVWSPWIAAVAFQLALFGGMLSANGWRGIRNWFHVWIFLWIIIPLPFGMDEDLIIYLRLVTTKLSSSVLDQIGMLHNSYANVIELPGKPLFIADACSGIHSLYVLMAGALFLAMWLGRGIIHSVALLLATFALVIAENVARIVLVAVLWGRGYDFSIGWNHELLGIALFCVSLALLVSLDQLFLFLLPSRIPSLLKWVYGWLSGDTDTPGKRTKARMEAGPLRTAVLILAGTFPLVGFAQLFNLPESRPDFITQLYEDFDLPELGKETLPGTIGDFQLEDYETVARVPGDPLGRSSQQWQYRNGNTVALVSIDYPYDGVHDLCECYGAIGWEVPEKRVVAQETLTSEYGSLADGPVAIGHLNRDLYGHAILMFNLTDSEGATNAIIKELARGDSEDRAARRLQSFAAAEQIEESHGVAPFVQFQLFARMPQSVNEQQENELTEFFLQARSLLKKQLDSSLQDAAQQEGK